MRVSHGWRCANGGKSSTRNRLYSNSNGVGLRRSVTDARELESKLQVGDVRGYELPIQYESNNKGPAAGLSINQVTGNSTEDS